MLSTALGLPLCEGPLFCIITEPSEVSGPFDLSLVKHPVSGLSLSFSLSVLFPPSSVTSNCSVTIFSVNTWSVCPLFSWTSFSVTTGHVFFINLVFFKCFPKHFFFACVLISSFELPGNEVSTISLNPCPLARISFAGHVSLSCSPSSLQRPCFVNSFPLLSLFAAVFVCVFLLRFFVWVGSLDCFLLLRDISCRATSHLFVTLAGMTISGVENW